MLALTRLYAAIFDPLDRLAPVITPTLARLAFLATLFGYYWNSAVLKLGDAGIASLFSPNANMFGQMLPKAAEAVLWDVTQATFFQKAIMLAGTWGEFILPVLIVIGLFTRLAALGMIGFILVQTLVDVTGHGAAMGTLFDSAYGLADERFLWIVLMLVIVVRGAGPISVDYGLGRALGRHWETETQS